MAATVSRRGGASRHGSRRRTGASAGGALVRAFAPGVQWRPGCPDRFTGGFNLMDREHWPPVIKQRMAEFKVEEVTAFIKLAAMSSRKKYFSEEAWAKLMKLQKKSAADHSRMWQARVDLFQDIEKALQEDPASEIAQALVARWRAQQDEASGGDSEIRAALLRGWAHRRHWPPSMRWQVEGLHMMSFERFEKAADFLDRAVAAGTPDSIKEDTPMTDIRRDVDALLAEFDEEMASTRRMLERVP